MFSHACKILHEFSDPYGVLTVELCSNGKPFTEKEDKLSSEALEELQKLAMGQIKFLDVRQMNMVLFSLVTFKKRPLPQLLTAVSRRLAELLMKSQGVVDDVTQSLVAYAHLDAARHIQGPLGNAFLQRISEVRGRAIVTYLHKCSLENLQAICNAELHVHVVLVGMALWHARSNVRCS